MSDDEIEAIAAQLEASARVEEARFRLEEFFEKESDSMANYLIANRAGFLLLAALLLRSAVKEENVASAALPAFKIEDHDLFFDKLERREKWPDPESEDTRIQWRDSFWICAVIGFCLTVIGIFMVGLAATFKMIFG